MPNAIDSYMLANDSIEKMEKAAGNRQDEGRALQAISRGFWSVYTLGYVVELCLKTAFLRLTGFKVKDDVTYYVRGRFPEEYAKAIGVQRQPRTMHDLLFWFEMIIHERALINRPINKEFAQEFALHLQYVAPHWRPEMRYHPAVRLGETSVQIAAASTWIYEHRQLLWR